MPRSLTAATPLLAVALALTAPHTTLAADDDAALAQRLDRLETALRAEEGVRAVKRLQDTMSHYLSEGLWNDAADLFTDDAVGEFVDGTVTGKANVERRLMQRAARMAHRLADGQLNAQLILQPIVTLGADGTTAKGAWHEVAMLGNFGASASWQGGIYENDYVRDGDVWKISHVRYFEQYSGGYDDPGHKAPAKWDIPYHFDAKHVGVTIPRSALEPAAPADRGVSTRRSAPAGERAAKLAQRVQRLEDETAVRNLVHSYGYYLDRKLWDDAADLFAESGTFELAQRGVYAGKARVRAALETLFGPAPLRRGELFDHIELATVVTISADGATAGARTSELAMIGLNGQYARWELGTYENELVKDGGVWKIAAVHYYPRVVTDYDAGWAKDAKAAAGPSKELPPNRPPTQAFASYPNVQYVGFHYANPVTGRAVKYPAGDGAVARVRSVDAPRSSARGPRADAAHDSAALGAQLDAVERRLNAAIGVDAVENLNSSYGYYIDESAWDDMADTFASTGSKEITGAGVYVGTERIRQILNLRGPRGGRTPTFFTIHQLTQPVIHVAADGKTAQARFRLFQGGGNADGSSGSWIGGIYENTAVVENGEWKFGVQDLTHTFNASYRNGWARVGGVTKLEGTPGDGPRDIIGGGIRQGLGGAAAPSRFAAEMPPDRPIRARQYAFPEIVEPAFHYANPVSGRAAQTPLP